jgi:eukaryotic-like serine/threonine-protein kinase
MADDPENDDEDERERDAGLGEAAALSDTFPLDLDAGELGLGHPFDGVPRGAVIGRHVILGRIATGGTGVVYAAFDPVRDRKIALKLLPIEDDDPREAVRRRDEVVARIDATKAVDHPAVVETYEVTPYDGGVIVAMEFVDGINLRQWMEARDEPFPWPEVLRVFREAGRGLAAAHAAGVIHGDFKPDNVLLAKEGRICILDFGLATELVEEEPLELDLSELKEALPGILSTHEESLPELTELGPVMGTPAYMAPERHVGGAGDQKTDQFSFCVAFYEALYGERPFRGSKRTTLADETIHARVREAPRDSRVPPWLREVLVRGLSPRRSDRYPSMAALLHDLDRDPKASRRRWVLGIGGVVGLGVVAAGVASLMAMESERCTPDEALLEGVWDHPARAELRRVLESAPRPHASETWRVVEARIDEWTTQWLELRELACRATRVRRDASEELLDARYSCLDARLDEVGAFIRVYGSTATPPMIDRAAAVASAIELPQNCVQLETLETTAPPPESIREVVAELQSLERDAWVALMASNVALARRGAERVHEGLSTSAFEPLRVHNTLLRGLVARAEQDALSAEALLHDAAGLANAEGLQQLSALAWLALLEGAAAAPERLGEAEVWVRHAEPVIDRVGDDRLRGRLLRARGDIARARGRAGDALGLYHRGLELLERAEDVSPFEIADAVASLGELVTSRSEHVSASLYYERALEIRQQSLGAMHPSTAESLAALGRARLGQQRYDDAQAELERARDIAVANDAPAWQLAALDLDLGDAELARNEIEAAIDCYDRAVVAARAPADALARSRRGNLLERALVGSARARLASGELEGVRASLVEALALQEAAQRDPILRGQTRELLATALWEEGEYREARGFATSAIDDYLSAGEVGLSHRQRVRAWLDSRAVQRSAPAIASEDP